jgi:hypothetical protein
MDAGEPAPRRWRTVIVNPGLAAMMDRILARALNCSVMALIVASATSSLLLGYRGLYRLVCNDVEAGMMWLFSGVLLGVGCYLLCRHRHELADS